MKSNNFARSRLFRLYLILGGIIPAQSVYASGLTFDDTLIGKLLPEHSLNDSISTADAADAVSRFRGVGAVITGLAAVTCVFFLALSIAKLGAAGDNEMRRRRALGGLLSSSVAIILLGGLSVYLGFLWKFL